MYATHFLIETIKEIPQALITTNWVLKKLCNSVPAAAAPSDKEWEVGGTNE